MTAAEPVGHRRAGAPPLTLYHVLHPANPDRDEWTQSYVKAQAYFEQFKRDYGGAHIHVETHYAGQYDARCLKYAGAGLFIHTKVWRGLFRLAVGSAAAVVE